MTESVDLHPGMTMEEIQGLFPSARRALFMRYHIGGCSTCAYQPTQTLQEVCADHNLLDVKEVMQSILDSHTMDQRIEMDVEEARVALLENSGWRLLDVRTEYERELADIAGSEHMTDELHAQLIEGDKQAKLLFFCHSGVRSLDAASFYAGHGFQNVKSMRGGIEAWSMQIDPTIPRY